MTEYKGVVPFVMEDWNQEDQESQEDRQSQDKMDTGPAPPPRIHFGSWAPKAPIREEKQEDQGPSMVSQSHCKSINGHFSFILYHG